MQKRSSGHLVLYLQKLSNNSMMYISALIQAVQNQLRTKPLISIRKKTVLKERNRELAYEGHYRWDLMRTDNILGDHTLGAIEKNRWNLPIPNYEIRISYGKLKQNTGYQE